MFCHFSTFSVHGARHPLRSHKGLGYTSYYISIAPLFLIQYVSKKPPSVIPISFIVFFNQETLLFSLRYQTNSPSSLFWYHSINNSIQYSYIFFHSWDDTVSTVTWSSQSSSSLKPDSSSKLSISKLKSCTNL